MTEVYFVRHAEPNYENHDDMTRELSEKGLQDRKLVTEYLLNKNIDVVISSPFKRAVDTVKDFADKVDKDIELAYDFRERRVESVWIEDFNTFAKAQWQDFSYKLSDGESLMEVQERNINALKSMIMQYENKNVVIGSHGTALSTVINYYHPDFGYNDFERIKKLMPWIVRFCFEGQRLVDIVSYDIFSIEENIILGGT